MINRAENVVTLPKTDLELLLAEWMADLHVAGRRPKARRSYQDTFRLFMKRTGIHTLDKFDAAAIKSYLIDIQEGAYADQPRGPVSSSTKHLHWRNFRAFIGWGLNQVNPPAFHASLVDKRPGVRHWFTVPEPMVEEDVIGVYSPAEIAKIEQAGKRFQGTEMKLRLALDRRYLLVMHTLLGTGMRISEALSRTPEDLIDNPDERPNDDDARAFFRLESHDTKGKRARYTPVSPRLYRDLMAYLRERPQSTSKALFVTAKGEGLRAHAVNDYMEALGERLGFRITPHKFRHTFATEFLKRRPGDIETLRRIMGHRNYTQINRYVEFNLQMLGQSWASSSPY